MEKASSNVSASSSNKSSRRRIDPRSRVIGIPVNCWCGANIVEAMSGTDDNPNRRFYRCGFAYSRKLRNDPHVFKWIDEAYKDEIQHLKYQVGQQEREIALMKSGGNPVGDQNVVTVLNALESDVFQHVEEMLASSRTNMKRIMALVFGAFLLVVVIVIVLVVK